MPCHLFHSELMWSSQCLHSRAEADDSRNMKKLKLVTQVLGRMYKESGGI